MPVENLLNAEHFRLELVASSLQAPLVVGQWFQLDLLWFSIKFIAMKNRFVSSVYFYGLWHLAVVFFLTKEFFLLLQDMRYGGTPLHWITQRPIMEAFIKIGCLLDARNFLGDTALHLMVSLICEHCLFPPLSFFTQNNIIVTALIIITIITMLNWFIS